MSAYRVWSPDDGCEEDGKSYADKPSGTGGLVEQVLASDTWALDAENAAEMFARYFHNECDGYECTWPLTFRVRSPDGTVADYSVEREYDPTFTARRKA